MKLTIYTCQWADTAQQEFSSDKYPTLHLGLPALEGLHRAWSKCLEDEKYGHFRRGLAAALDKIREYYNLTADNDTFVFSTRKSSLLNLV